MFKLNTQEGQRLTALMLTMRPDWTPNNPARMLHTANETTGLPGMDFDHAVRALAHYATTRGDDGRHVKRTPDLYPLDGTHWSSTAPTGWSATPEPPCEDHPEHGARTCRCCWGDVRAGERNPDQVGKRLEDVAA